MGILIGYLLGIWTATKSKSHVAQTNTAQTLTAELHISQPIEVKTEPKNEHKGRWIYDRIVSTLTLGFVAAYTFITILIFCQSKRSADAAQSAARTAASQLELTQRPWVFVKDAKVISPLVFDKDGAHVTFEVIVRNSGLTPAVDVSINPRLYILPTQESGKPPVERLCDASDYHGYRRGSGGTTIFPNTDSPADRITVGLPRDQIDTNSRNGIVVINPLICVLYRSSFRNEGPGYSSAIQYWMWPTVSSGKTTSIPPERLPLLRSGFFGESAH